MAYKIGTIVKKQFEVLEANHNIQMVGFDEMSRGGFTVFPKYLFDLNLSLQAKMVYALLLDYGWNKGFCFPGQKALATKLKVQDKTIRKYLQELQKAGTLKIVKRGWGQTNVYILYCQPRKKNGKGITNIAK